MDQHRLLLKILTVAIAVYATSIADSARPASCKVIDAEGNVAYTNTKPLPGWKVLDCFTNAERSAWSLFNVGDHGFVFIDSGPPARQGTLAKVWTLEDYYELQQPHGAPWRPFRSIKTQYQLDCKGRQLGVLQVLFYSEVDGEGKVISSQNVAKPVLKSAVPGSVGEYLLVAACALVRNN